MPPHPTPRFRGGQTRTSDFIAERISAVDARRAAPAALSNPAQPPEPVDTRMQHQAPRVAPIITR